MTRRIPNRVVHLVRKLLPPTASFIRNQITSHINYIPFVVYKEFVDSPFAYEIISNYGNLRLSGACSDIKRIYSNLLYGKLRRITGKDVAETLSYLKHNEVQLLHFHYGTDAGMYSNVLRFSQLPSVVSFYGYDYSSFPRWYFGLGKYYLKRVFRDVDYSIAMSDDMRNDLVNLGCPKDKVIVHYYGSDVYRFVHKRAYDSKEEVTILIVASLDEKKGHIYLLKSLERLEKTIRSRLHVKIVGSGPLDSELREYVKSHDLGGVVSFVRALEYLSKQFLKEFRDADIFAHPSVAASNGDKEGIPGTIVEAMAAGLPVISTYHAGIPYVIQQEETGLLVRERDVDALAVSIGRLVLDSNMRRKIGQNARKYALEHLDLRRRQIELENIYDFVIENHARNLSRQR